MKTYEDDDLTASKEEEEKSMSSLHILAEVASTLYDELQCTNKAAKSKIVDTEEEEEEVQERIFHNIPTKARTRRRNLSGSSRPSSFSSASFSVLRDDNNTSKSIKIQENPPNPNPKSSKKRVVQERKQSCGGAKKAKVSPSYSWKGRGPPHWLTHLMRDLKERNIRRRRTHLKEEDPRDLKLIYEKTLFKTDVHKGESRLSMPYKNLIDKDFLKQVELGVIEADIESESKAGVGALLFDERFNMWGVMLKRWEMGESFNYALTCGWNEIVEANGLRQGDDVSVWCFRWCGVLCFALVRPPPPPPPCGTHDMGQSNTSSSCSGFSPTL